MLWPLLSLALPLRRGAGNSIGQGQGQAWFHAVQHAVQHAVRWWLAARILTSAMARIEYDYSTITVQYGTVQNKRCRVDVAAACPALLVRRAEACASDTVYLYEYKLWLGNRLKKKLNSAIVCLPEGYRLRIPGLSSTVGLSALCQREQETPLRRLSIWT